MVVHDSIMAGDVSYLCVCKNDNENTILDERYIGKLRYDNNCHKNVFSMDQWKYIGHDGTFNYNEHRDKINNNRYSSYTLLTNKIIEEMRFVISNFNPETPSEQKAYEDTMDALEFIEEMKEKYKDSEYTFLFWTVHD